MSLIRGNQVTKLDFFSPEIQPFETINKWQELFIGVSVNLVNKQKVDVKKIIKPNFQFPAFLPRSLACLNTLTLFSSFSVSFFFEDIFNVAKVRTNFKKSTDFSLPLDHLRNTQLAIQRKKKIQDQSFMQVIQAFALLIQS